MQNKVNLIIQFLFQINNSNSQLEKMVYGTIFNDLGKK